MLPVSGLGRWERVDVEWLGAKSEGVKISGLNGISGNKIICGDSPSFSAAKPAPAMDPSAMAAMMAMCQQFMQQGGPSVFQ